MSRWPLATAWFALAAPAAASGLEAGRVTIEDAWARPTAAAQRNGVISMVLRNRGREPERLLGVRTGRAKSAELHGTTVTVEGVPRMRPVEAVEIPPGDRTELGVGGPHVMLVGLEAPLVEGASFPLTLVFERSGEVEVEVTVESRRASRGRGGGLDAGHGLRGGD